MTESSSASSAQAPASRWEDYIDIFYAPSRVFARREQGGFLVPLIVLVVAMAILYFATADVLRPVFEADFARGMAQAREANPELTPEQMESIRSGMRMTVPFFLVGYSIVAPLVAGVLLWMFGKVVGARAGLGTTMMVGTFAFYPRIVESILNGIQAFALPVEQLDGRYSLSIGPARFLDPDTASPLALAFLGRVDLFTLWITVLLAIGLKVTGRISTGQAAVVAILIWLVGALPALAGALSASAG